VVREILFAPGDWLGSRFDARERRAVAAWLLILAIVTMPLRYVWKDAIWMIWALSEGALIISLATIVAAETPVEEEGE
jgi:hypothetical protein